MSCNSETETNVTMDYAVLYHEFTVTICINLELTSKNFVIEIVKLIEMYLIYDIFVTSWHSYIRQDVQQIQNTVPELPEFFFNEFERKDS